jgi:hypothetical protein
MIEDITPSGLVAPVAVLDGEPAMNRLLAVSRASARPPLRCLLVILVLVFEAFATPGPAADSSPMQPPRFERDVLPILRARCLECHGPDKQKGSLDLRTREAMLQGGENGPAISPGDLKKSLLWTKLTKNQMPPGKTKLTAAEKTLIEAWIAAGAQGDERVASKTAEKEREVSDADRQFWSFRPPVQPAVPAIQHAERVRTPIDAFILQALEGKGLSLAPEADRLTLLRRATFDLLGLPPTPQEVEAFLADKSADAYERLVDRLLASEHYGEHWARHWLDLAGYADSEGVLDADYVRTAAWRYRDYVIDALNKDKPYDRFLKEQIAGDELTGYWTVVKTKKELGREVVEALIATGFLRCASDTSRPELANIKNAAGYYYQTLDDTVKIVASATMGLTLECAKCHSHKFDPIPQSDYYRVQAIFMSAYRPAQWVAQPDRRLLEVSALQESEAAQRSATAIRKAKQKAAELKKEFAGYLFTGRLGALPQAIRDDVRLALMTEPSKRTTIQKYLADKFDKDLRPDADTLDRVLPETFVTYKARLKELDDNIKAAQKNMASFAEIRALYDVPGETHTRVLRRGEYTNPGGEVQPGVPVALTAARPFSWSPPAKDAKTSGRRLAFAEWLTQPEHPLTTRVLVNRLWLQHFGEGIVSTPDNFGHTGTPPSHPELLDWLATEFVNRGWSLKAMHRLIMTSSTYRQASTVDAAVASVAKRADPEDRLLWRQRMRRLEAEALRDTILSVAGTLNAEKGGPPVAVQPQPDGDVTPPADASGHRRSIYLQVRRSQPVTMLQVFDQPVMEINCTRRGISTITSQALALLNGDFMISQADALAARALHDKPADAAAYALELAFGRPATDAERAKLTAFLSRQAERHATNLSSANGPTGLEPQTRRRALADICQMLLSANEFVYVD